MTAFPNKKDEAAKKPPYINAHAHVFTTKHVPPYLGRKVVPAPIAFLFNIPLLAMRINQFRFPKWTSFSSRVKRGWGEMSFFINRLTHHSWYGFIFQWLAFLLLICTLVCLLILFRNYLWDSPGRLLQSLHDYLNEKGIGWKIRGGVMAFTLIALKSGRNLLGYTIKKILSYLKVLPGPYTNQLLQRYLQLARYSRYDAQEDIFEKVDHMYPDNTGFVLLPMDMDYMEAGKPQWNYLKQLQELYSLRNDPGHRYNQRIHPFIFAHPARMADPSPISFADDFQIDKRRMLNPGNFDNYASLVTDFLQHKNFKGIKIYPALGYYPFDKDLLRLWRFACDNQVPITTHCIRGIIFYRGDKKKEWNFHPVLLKTPNVADSFIELKSFSNMKFQENFTHPLNYEVLLNPWLLAGLLRLYKADRELMELYDFDPEKEGALPGKDLRELKICFAHFGGDDEWNSFLDNETGQFDNRFTPIQFGTERITGSVNQLWNRTSWYSIIRSMMAQYPNVYADISFIVSNDKTFNLLRHTLRDPLVQKKVLYGSDFYVVRQKKSDKQIWNDVAAYLHPDELDLIARYNPAAFLSSRFHT